MTQPALQLRDIHLPPTPGWWPLAPGWWLLIALGVAVLAAITWWWRRRRRARQRLDRVLAELDAARVQSADRGDVASYARMVSQLLRRVARQHDASIVVRQGEAWTTALATIAPRVDIAPLGGLEAAMYQPSAPLDVDAVHRSAHAFIRAMLPLRRRRHA